MPKPNCIQVQTLFNPNWLLPVNRSTMIHNMICLQIKAIPISSLEPHPRWEYSTNNLKGIN